MTEPQTEESLGIAQKLAEDFLPAFQNKRETLLSYFGEGATLVWNGCQMSGNEEISKFLSELPELMLNITGIDVQTVQSPKSWTMAIYTGTIMIESDSVQDFHCSIFVEALPSSQTAFVRYMTFKYF